MKRLIPVLKQDGVDTQLIMLIRTILAGTKEIAFRVSQGELAGVLGSTLNSNIQGEVQKKLDILSNQLPKDLRARLFYLAEFVAQHSSKVFSQDASVQPLIDINAAIMGGLNAQEAS